MYILKVLLSHPADLTPEEEEALRHALTDYNKSRGEHTGCQLHPLDWKEDAYSQFGTRPQESLDHQLVDRCDMVVAVFRHRLGTPTLVHESGTVEEIAEARRQNKPVFIHWYAEEPDVGGLSSEERQKVEREYSRLVGFMDRNREHALVKRFASAAELRGHVLEDLRNFLLEKFGRARELAKDKDGVSSPGAERAAASFSGSTISTGAMSPVFTGPIQGSVYVNSAPGGVVNPIDAHLDIFQKKK